MTEPLLSRGVTAVALTIFICVVADAQSETIGVHRHAAPISNAGMSEHYFADGQRYFVYVSEAALQNPHRSTLLVSVHGYSGRTDDSAGVQRVVREITRWDGYADTNNWVILAPHFMESLFNNDYQRLNFKGPRADQRLDELVKVVETLVPGLDAGRFLLFGFSGGGQFVHRYALLHPDRIAAMVIGAPGWYTWPDDALPYPIGTAAETLPADAQPDWLALAGLDGLIVVGEEDHDGGAFRRSFGDYNLDSLQGTGRVDRARNWHSAVHSIADRAGVSSRLQLEIIADTQHNISRSMRSIVTDFFTRSTAE